MGRRNIKIKAIKDDRNRSVTFLKRKGALFKKAQELSVLCSVDVAVFMFGSNKKLYEYSSRDMRELITRYQFHGGPNEHIGPSDFNSGGDDDDEEDMEDMPPCTYKGFIEPQMTPLHFQGQHAFPHLRHHTPSASHPIDGMPFVTWGHTPQPQMVPRPLSHNSQRPPNMPQPAVYSHQPQPQPALQHGPPPVPAQYQYFAGSHPPQIPSYIKEARRSSDTPSYPTPEASVPPQPSPPQIHIQKLPPQPVPHVPPPQPAHQHLNSLHTNAQTKEEDSNRAQSVGTSRSRLQVQISGGASNTSSNPRKIATNLPQVTADTSVQSTRRTRRNRANASGYAPRLPLSSPSTTNIASAGTTGPPNPFAWPPPQSHSPGMNIDTPISAPPSRFLDNEFLPSPSSFYPDWNFRGNDSITLASPLNFATPFAESWPLFVNDDGAGFYTKKKSHQSSPKVVPTITRAMGSLAKQDEANSGEFGSMKGPMDEAHILSEVQNFVKTADRLGYDTSFESPSPLVRDKLYPASKHSMDRAVDVLRATDTHTLSTEHSPYATQTTVCSNSIEFITETHLALLDYIKQNLFNKRSEVSTLVTITGTASYAYATTCLDYLKSTWPDTGEILLPILQEATQQVLHQPNSTAKISKEHDQLWALSIELCGDGSLKLRAKGSKIFAVDIMQQLCWLTATFSTPSPSEETICYCTPKIELIGDSFPAQPIFRLGASFTQLHASERNSCWLSLFSNAVIAHGFPIPERADGIGLEMSVELMAAIIGARHAATFDGGVVIKGFSSMFVPVMRTSDGVQWHYVGNSDPDMQLSYEEGAKKCSNRLLDLDFASLTTARCFIGWNSLVDVRVGDETNNFNNIEFSDAAEVKAALQIPGGSLGFQQFGLAQIDVTFGKRDGKCHFQRNSSYRRIVSAAERMFVALFDTGERRSYLVPASGLLLHILRHRLSSGLGGVPASKVKILSAKSFTETLLKNAKVRLTSEGDEPLFVEDVVSEIWSVLELLQAQSISAEKNSKLEIHATWQERLLGYEYKAVVEDWSPMPLKELEIHKTCGGWPRLIRDINALVLLANGFGDLIQPIGNQTGLCHQWKTLPRGKDYMAVPVSIFLGLYSLAGCPESKKRLTATNLALHGPGTSLFQPCHTPKEWQCSCDRLQQVVSISSFGHICVPELVEGNGALIIGESGSLLKRFTKRTMPKIAGIIGNHAKVVSEGEAFLSSKSDTFGLSIGSESGDFRHSNTSSPASSVADDNEGSSKNLDSIIGRGSFDFRRRRKRRLSEVAGAISTVSSCSAVDSPRLVKQQCLGKLPCRNILLADGTRS